MILVDQSYNWEKLIEHRLIMETKKFGELISIHAQKVKSDSCPLIEDFNKKTIEKKKDLHITFIDLENTYAQVPREVI